MTTATIDTNAVQSLDLKTEQGMWLRDVLLFLCDDSPCDPLFRQVTTGVSVTEARDQKRVGEIPPRVPRRLRSPMEWVVERRAEAERRAVEGDRQWELDKMGEQGRIDILKEQAKSKLKGNDLTNVDKKAYLGAQGQREMDLNR